MIYMNDARVRPVQSPRANRRWRPSITWKTRPDPDQASLDEYAQNKARVENFKGGWCSTLRARPITALSLTPAMR